MKFRKWMMAGLAAAALVGCGKDDPQVLNNNTTSNNTTANNTTANNTTANNTTANNTTANNTTANNTTTTNSNTNMNTNSGNPLACAGDFGAADACGGSPVGTWDVSEGCTNFDYEAQIQQACASAVVDQAVVDVTGTLTVDATTFTQAVSGSVSVTMNTPDGCGLGNCGFVETGLGAFATTATCTDDGSGGCDCSASFDAADTSSGTYTTANGVATLGSGETYYYCVSGGTMLLRQFGTAADDAIPTTLYTAQ